MVGPLNLDGPLPAEPNLVAWSRGKKNIVIVYTDLAMYALVGRTTT